MEDKVLELETPCCGDLVGTAQELAGKGEVLTTCSICLQEWGVTVIEKPEKDEIDWKIIYRRVRPNASNDW